MKSGARNDGAGEAARMKRRDLLKGFAIGAAAYGVPEPALAEFVRELRQGPYQWKFFTAPELAMIRPLADLIIPRDERGPAATEAGVVEYADFVLSISDERTRTAWRDGFTWLNDEAGRRFQKRFIDAAESERRQILDDIAWPARAAPERASAASWFNRVRDLVGSGYWSSQPGVQDLGYIGGVFNPEWRGAPPEALQELNVSYDEWDRKYGTSR